MSKGRSKQASELALSITLVQGEPQVKKKEIIKKLRSTNVTVDDLFFRIDEEDELDMIALSKKNDKKLMQKLVLYSMNIVGRWLSVTDLVTDGILFYRATVYGKDNHATLPLTIGLFTSMIAPYILSYSSGVKLFLFRGTFKELEGFYRILLLLFLFPTGVLYFVFLDILDIFLNLFRWIVTIVFRWKEIKVKQLEEVLALQVGMDRMNWEGFKRQKSVAQLMFETVPQLTMQGLLFWDVIPGKHLAGIDEFILLISITSASLNCIRQIIKLILESRAVRQNVIEYSLHCVMARVGWVPFRNTIDTFRIANQTQADPYPLSIDFNIKYAIPCITKCCGITASMEYDFSSRTIRHLVAVLSMVEGKSKYHDAWTDERILSIKFGKTLRLLTLQDLLLLLSVCQKQNIKILDIIEPKVFDFGTAIQMSKKMDKDCRLFQHARNAQGRPLLMVFADLALDPPEIQSKMMYRLLQYDLDVNLTDVASGESLIFSLLRHFDYSTIRYLLTRYCEGKKIKINLNYYNKNGLSPLYVALQSYRNEKHMKCKRFMFDYLMSYDAPLLNASIKENTAMSPLWFAIKVIDDKTLIKTLLQRGCKLNIEEMNKLSHLYCDYAIKDNNKILATITQSKQPNDDEKEEEKANEPDINEQIHAIRKLRYEFIKYRIDATKKGNDIDEDDTFVFES
eukprot:625049_1